MPGVKDWREGLQGVDQDGQTFEIQIVEDHSKFRSGFHLVKFNLEFGRSCWSIVSLQKEELVLSESLQACPSLSEFEPPLQAFQACPI